MECPASSAGPGRACRSASGYPTDHHRARRDAAGPPPYEVMDRLAHRPDEHGSAVVHLDDERRAAD
ncbi:hypothetical protein [Streptomyces sp. NPDC052721]|uniref:hypothetical protein n=1 Tax=Streptomyces sp. NPDC052721 TaxID=3154955 RepID=UPI003448D45D